MPMQSSRGRPGRRSGSVLSVEAGGSGIADAETEKSFAAGHSSSDAGTGLAPNIVKQVADAPGWEVRVTARSEGGCGSRVLALRLLLIG
jgi:signal transduction histidine kinase